MIVQAVSPGRINLIGEHTDYNEGYVMPAAINQTIKVSIQKNGSPNQCNAHSLDLDERFSFDLNNITAQPQGWQNYILGVTAELQKIGAHFEGFDVSFGGDVPIGAGLSSSAALECSFATALNELFNLGFRQMQLIKAAQLSEHNYAGTMCGIMDQFASTMGKSNSVIRLDCKTLDYDYFPLDLGQYKLLLINTKVSHSLADTEYNTRREECEQAVATIAQLHPNVKSLRYVDMRLLQKYQSQLSPIVYQRAKYIIEENARVQAASKALEEKDFTKLGQLLYQSHHGLQHEYEVSCKELDFLVDLTRDKDYILGARMMGGGFGGCTLNFIEEEKIPVFIEEAYAKYSDQFNIDPEHYIVSIGDGARIVTES